MCRQQIFDGWTKSTAGTSPLRGISQAAYETMLNVDDNFCQLELPITLGVNCCNVRSGNESMTNSVFLDNLVPLIAPKLRSNFDGFGRIQDLILVQVYFSLVSEFIQTIQALLNDFFTWKFQGGLQRKVFDSFLAQDMGFFDARPTGVLLSRIMNDTANVKGVAAILAIFVKVVARVSLSVSVAYNLNPSLFYLFVCLIPLEFFIIYRQGVFIYVLYTYHMCL